MEKSKKDSSFVIQGSILAIAGIIVRLIGMLYRIPLNNIIGDEGMGYYSSAFSVYSIMLIVSSYSLPVAVSKLVAARIGKGQYRNSIRILKAALFYATVAGGVACGILWFGAEYFAEAMKMPLCAFAIRTLAPTIWVMAYLGVLRGYFQGHGTMVPTAISQIFEQIVNALVSVTAASILFKQGMRASMVRGEGSSIAYSYGAGGGTIGTGAGALTAFILFLFLILAYRKTMRRQERKDRSGVLESYGTVSYLLCITVFPIVLSSAIYNISTVVDNYIFGNGMAHLGRESQIAASWGVYMGKYHLLFNIPVAIANALSSSLIPSLSRAVAAKNRGQILDKVTTAVRFAMVVAIPSTVGLAVLAGPISHLLFRNNDNTMLIRMTVIGAVAVVFFSLSTVTNAVLQGINHMRVPIRNASVSLVVHVILLSLLIYVFHMDIYAVVYANIVFAFTICILNGFCIRKYLHYRQEYRKTFILPTLASLVMGAVSWGIYHVCYRLISSNMISTLAAVGVAVIVYAVLLLKLGCVDEVELYSMTGGRKLVRIARKFHLIS